MTPDEQEKLINEVEKELDRLHALYNQYFMGIEKLEPTVPRKVLDRKIYALRREKIRNTALRFRLQMQIQKYNTQSTYWTRVCQQIENGTYKRQVMLANRRIKARRQTKREGGYRVDDALPASDDLPAVYTIDTSELGMGLDEPFSSDALSPRAPEGEINSEMDEPFEQKSHRDHSQTPPLAARPNAPAEPAMLPREGNIHEIDEAFLDSAQQPRKSRSQAARPVAKAAVANERPHASTIENGPAVSRSVGFALTKERAEAIYRAYLVARKKCNQPTDSISFRQVAKSLGQTYVGAGGKVDFKVVIKKGKAVITTVKKPE